MKKMVLCLAIIGLFVSSLTAAEFGMKQGTPAMKSAGPLAFGKNGVLFVGDTKSATIFAIDTKDREGNPNDVELKLDNVEKQIADAFEAEKVSIQDFAINPLSGAGYVSVAGNEGKLFGLAKISPNGHVEKLSLDNVDFSKVELPNPPADEVVGRGRRARNYRGESITDLAFMEGKVLVSGVSGNERESTVRELVFPFHEADKGVNVEIFHGAHGRYETTATVRTFVPFKIGGEPYLLAGFVCTPLVKFPIEKLKGDETLRGTTVAELGNRNRPLDMFVYSKDGKEFLLLSNSARGVMKISTADVEREEGITERIQGTAGQTYDTIESLKGVEQMDKLNDGHAVLMARNDSGSLDLVTIELP